MLRNHGTWYMLIVAFLFAMSVNFDKMVILNSNPFFGMAPALCATGGAFILTCLFTHLLREQVFAEIIGCYRSNPHIRAPCIPVEEVYRAYYFYRCIHCHRGCVH
ncbi:MAG: hypothetical protein M0Q91_09385 [Methanoregula sp.]|nr:hypothetical protein [Methanoregula sp.]